MISIISLSITMSTVIFLLTYFIQDRKRELVTSEIKIGEVCYKCKSDTGYVYDWLSKEDIKRRLCKSCEREKILNSVLNKRLLNIDYSSKKCIRLGNILNFIAIGLNITAIFYSPIGIFGGIFLFIGMFLFYKHFMATTRPKKVQSA